MPVPTRRVFEAYFKKKLVFQRCELLRKLDPVQPIEGRGAPLDRTGKGELGLENPSVQMIAFTSIFLQLFPIQMAGKPGKSLTEKEKND